MELLRKLQPFLRPYRGRLVAGLFFGILYAITNALLMVGIKVVSNLVFGGKEVKPLADQIGNVPEFLRQLVHGVDTWLQQTSAHPDSARLALAIWAIPVIMTVRGLCAYLNAYLVQWTAAHTIADLRTRLFEHLQNLSLSFFHTARTGELISRITSDTQALHVTISQSAPSMVRDPVTVIALLVLLVSQQPRLTLITMVVFPFCIVPIVVYGRKIRRSARAMQTNLADLSGLMHESFTGNRIVKAYNLEERVVAQFRATTKKVVGNVTRVVRANEIPSNLMEIFGGLGVAMVFHYVAFRTDRSMSLGDFLQFIASVFMLYQPVKYLSRLHTQLQQAQAASERVFELLYTRTTVLEPRQPKPLHARGADIEFRGVSFDYDEKPVLRDIQLTVKAGQLVALVGASGSGKTTLTNLLLRFYDPRKGAVLIGGTDLREVALRDLRDQIAVVTQETILFNDTIRQNILLGRPGAGDAGVENAARHAFAHEFIMEKTAGYDTVVGERGTTLSGGQRQRLAIARAIFKDAPILVLDEATSALDSESERTVQAALDELMQGRTTLCIAHRLSTIQRADRIVVLERGRIVETGRHEELLERRGFYARLHALQVAGNAAADESSAPAS